MVKYSATAKYHEFLGAITQHAAEGMLVYSTAGQIILANQAVSDLFGYSAAELEGTNLARWIPDNSEKSEILSSFFSKTTRENTSFNINIPSENGAFRSIDIMVGQTTLSDGEKIFIANCRDITNQREVALQLEQQAEILRLMHDAVVVADKEFKILSCNTALEKIVGKDKDAIIGQDIYSIIDVKLPAGVLPETPRRIAVEEGRWHGVVEMTAGDGHLITADVLLFPKRDQNGEIECFISVVRDVSDRVEADRRIQETQRIESLGRLAGGVAHDINNLLFPILLNLEDAIDAIKEDDEPDEAIERISTSMDACLKIKRMIEQILHFSRDNASGQDMLNVSATFADAWDLVKMIIPTSVEVSVDISEDCGSFIGNPVQVSQVLLNLISNAIGAMEQAPGKLTCTLTHANIASLPSPRFYKLKHPEYAVLSVTDTGSGIAEDIMDNIFDPFFTTKSVGEGTGLGLTEVVGIIRELDGAIDIVSEVNKGTNFTLYMPVNNSEQLK